MTKYQLGLSIFMSTDYMYEICQYAIIFGMGRGGGGGPKP